MEAPLIRLWNVLDSKKELKAAYRRLIPHPKLTPVWLRGVKEELEKALRHLDTLELRLAEDMSPEFEHVSLRAFHDLTGQWPHNFDKVGVRRSSGEVVVGCVVRDDCDPRRVVAFPAMNSVGHWYWATKVVEASDLVPLEDIKESA